MSDYPEKNTAVHEEISSWPDRLEAVIAPTRFQEVRVLLECDSTQDAAKSLGQGSVLTTGRQKAGRGRRGARWSDLEGAGIAVSFVVENTGVAKLSSASVLAVLDAMNAIGGSFQRVGVKFPNDVVHQDGRKMAGVLVETHADLAVIGVGVNVHTHQHENDFSTLSLEELIPNATRISMLEAMVLALDKRLAQSDSVLSHDFRACHVLNGCEVDLEVSGERFTGTLRDADPFGNIDIETDSGKRSFRSEHVRIQRWVSG